MNLLVLLQQEVTDTGGARAAQISPPSDIILYAATTYKEETDNVKKPKLRDLFSINQNTGDSLNFLSSEFKIRLNSRKQKFPRYFKELTNALHYLLTYLLT